MVPFVSVCTPTFNRRPFIPTMIKCFNNQTYPKERIEWIIVDDGTDKIEDLVCNIKQVKYYKFDTKMKLGEKRNFMNSKCNGDIIVYMDDDDYYPPERISHAVDVLMRNPIAMCAGSSEMYIYFKTTQSMYQCGPYGPNHSTAATFAFRIELLQLTAFNNDSSIAEEQAFLRNYTVPFAQLDPMKSILVFSHVHNSFNKNNLLETPNKYICKSERTVDEFIKEEDVKQFFMADIDDALASYEPGVPKYKQDVLSEIERITDERIYSKLLRENALLKDKNTYLEMKVTQLLKMVINLKKN